MNKDSTRYLHQSLRFFGGHAVAASCERFGWRECVAVGRKRFVDGPRQKASTSM